MINILVIQTSKTKCYSNLILKEIAAEDLKEDPNITYKKFDPLMHEKFAE